MRVKEILIGEKVYLRQCRIQDVTERYVAWLNNKMINQYLETRFVSQTMENVTDYVKRVLDSDNEYLFAIIANQNDEHIGNLHLTIDQHHNRASVAYFIGDTNYWGEGRPVEILKLATKYAFDILKVDRIGGGIYSKNIFSLKAALKAGYKKEGYRPSYVKLDNGVRDGVYLIGMVREDYENLYYLNKE